MDTTPPWAHLNQDLADLIFTKLPLQSIIISSTVCKHWHCLISDHPFRIRFLQPRKPWFLLYGQNNVFFKQNQAFGFDPFSNSWIRNCSPHSGACFAGSGGLVLFSGTSSKCFRYSPIFGRPDSHKETSPLSYTRLNPLVGAFSDEQYAKKLVVVGGARFIGGLVDIEEEHQRLAVEIYDFANDSWELGPPLSQDFSSGNSSQWLCSCLLNDRLFFVFGKFSSKLSAFDLKTNVWSGVITVRPNGVLFSFLVSCKDRLILAGLCDMKVALWEVTDYEKAEYEEISVMPGEIMWGLFDLDGDASRFASLKCVGLDGVIYMFNEDHHKGYPSCVCEVDDDKVCTWRMMPPLPVPINTFHKVIAFCSAVTMWE